MQEQEGDNRIVARLGNTVVTILSVQNNNFPGNTEVLAKVLEADEET